MEKYMKIAIEEAKKAANSGDIPVGAVIVKNGKVISVAHNEKEKNNSPLDHAEMIAIKNACKKLNTWHLDDCEIYITMEPCMMCTGAIIQSRIKKIYYAIENDEHRLFIDRMGCNKSFRKIRIYTDGFKDENEFNGVVEKLKDGNYYLNVNRANGSFGAKWLFSCYSCSA